MRPPLSRSDLLPASLLALLLVLPPLTVAAAAQGSGAVAAGLAFDLQARTLGGMRAQVASLLVQGGRAGSISLEALAAPVAPAPGDDGTWTVPLLVEIEGPSLLAGSGEAQRLGVEIYAYSITPQGSVAGFLTQEVHLDLVELGESLYDSGLKLVSSLRLPPGRQSLRVLVMDAASGAYGLRTVEIAVPSRGEETPRLFAALVPEPPHSWLLLRQDIEPPRRRGGAVAVPETEAVAGPPPVAPEVAVAPLLSGPDGTLPAALPVLDSGSSAEVHLLGYHLPDEVEIVAQLEPEANPAAGDTTLPPAQSLPLEVLARLGTSVPGLERLSGRLQLPALPTSSFRLHFATAKPGANGGPVAATEPLRLIVLENNPLPGRLVWGRLRSLAAAVEQGEGGVGELDLPRRGKKRTHAMERAVRQRYEETLARFADGATPAEVVTAVAALEEELAAADADAFQAIPTAEVAVARALAERQPEALVPLIRLHLELYLEHRRARNYALATVARNTTRSIASLYATQAGSDAARAIASQALTALGWDLFEVDLRSAGEEALTTALDLDADNSTAQLLLGAYYEKMGEYRLAVEVLQELVASHPKSAEGRLRLALNRRRLGDESGARRELGRLLAENNPPWTLTVAYSELAGAYLSEGRTGDAATLLRTALDRLPGEECLLIQLAYTLDRERQFLEARQVLRRLRATGASGGDSPRHRYTDWPRQGLVEARDNVTQSSAARLPQLAGALAQGPLFGGAGGS